MSEGSLLMSPHGTVRKEDSFHHFMSRMVHLYVQEEEVRARHQATLLQLREDALKEKTKVHVCVCVCMCVCMCVCVHVCVHR